jgi:putative SOS response-associated peptidase YedK
MCGKFTAMASWAEVVRAARLIPSTPVPDANDHIVTYRPYSQLPVIIWNSETKRREVIRMRWGLPDAKNWETLKHIHARGETIDTKRAFAPLFLGGRRGIVLMNDFNETPPDNNDQWTINPGDGMPRGFAFLCQGYEIVDGREKKALRACCMVTVPANRLLRESIHQTDPDPRMPAILMDQDWEIWLGEKEAPIEDVKAVLHTMEGAGWTIAPEPKKEKPSKASKPKASPQPKKPKGETEPGLF